jgi:hypothetical protein
MKIDCTASIFLLPSRCPSTHTVSSSAGMHMNRLAHRMVVYLCAPCAFPTFVCAVSCARSDAPDASTTKELSVYVTLGILTALLAVLRNFGWFHATYSASKRLHAAMLAAVIRSPMSWFNATPQVRTSMFWSMCDVFMRRDIVRTPLCYGGKRRSVGAIYICVCLYSRVCMDLHPFCLHRAVSSTGSARI